MAAPEMRLVAGSAVDLATGEMPDESSKDERVVHLEGVVDDLERELRAKRAQIKKLMREAEEKRERQAVSPIVQRVFDQWREASGHARAILGAKRFDAIFNRLQEGYTEQQLTMAAWGVAFDPFTKPRKNGTLEHFDDIELACRNEINVERMANRCPVEKRRELSGMLFEVAPC